MMQLMRISMVLLMSVVTLVACNAGGGGGHAGKNSNPAYAVTYNGNGNTDGSVPIDSNNYTQGQAITVLGNTGNLVNANLFFAGWNTLSDGTGTTYMQAQTFAMGTANVTLYAMWTTNPGPAGGTIISSNGVKLVIPPGALDAETAITITDVPAAQIDAILSNPAMISTRTKRFLGGFSAEPDGLTFNVPVEAWVPVSALNPHEIPIQLSVQLNDGTYSYSSSTLEYDGNLHMVKLELQHFSTEVVAALSPAQFNMLCTSCGTFDSGVCWAFDPLEPPCCLLSPAIRTSCAAAAGCGCCEENKIKVVTVASDNTIGGCQFLGEDISITFPDCPGSPTQSDCQTETDCPDLTLSLTITPPNMCLFVGQVGTFSATATGTRNNTTVFQNAAFFPIWISDQPSVATFVDQDGNIQGIAGNPTSIQVHAMVSVCSDVTSTAYVNAFDLSGQWHAVGAVGSSSCGGKSHSFDDVFTVTQTGDTLTVVCPCGLNFSGEFHNPDFSLFGPIFTDWFGCPTVIHHCAKTLSADYNTVTDECLWTSTCLDANGNVTFSCSGTYDGTFTRMTPDCP